MNILKIFLVYTVLIGLSSSLNPVKMSFVLVILSLILFFTIFESLASIWMSSIFFMVFIGGIMVMFMILSSLLPNEKNLKSKKITVFLWIVLLLSISLPSSMNQVESSVFQDTKFIFMSAQSFQILMMVTFMYFLSFIYIISKETSSLRSFLCQI